MQNFVAENEIHLLINNLKLNRYCVQMKTNNFIWIQTWSSSCWKSAKAMATMQNSSFEKPRLFDRISFSDYPRHSLSNDLSPFEMPIESLSLVV